MRILSPLKKVEGQFVPTSFDEAFQLIYSQIKRHQPEDIALFAGGKLSNEELYLIQKWARIGIKTNAVASFEYLERPDAFCFDKNDIVPIAELAGSTRCYCLGFDENDTHPQLQLINKLITKQGTPCHYINKRLPITDETAFFKAVNYYLVSQKLTRGIFIEQLAKNKEAYLNYLSIYDLQALLSINHLTEEQLKDFVLSFLEEPCPVIIYYEPAISFDTIKELNNLALLTGIQAQPSSGLLGIKKNINSQGLFDMGISPALNVGGEPFNNDNLQISRQIYGIEPTHEPIDVLQKMIEQAFKVCLIFQENPIVDTNNRTAIANALEKAFVVQQTDCMNETSEMADLILPASLPAEEEGTYTDSTRMVFKIEKEEGKKIEITNFEQLAELCHRFGMDKPNHPTEVFLDYISFFKTGCRSAQRHFFKF